MSPSEETAFEGLTEQLAIAISHAERYEQACAQSQSMRGLDKIRTSEISAILAQARNVLSVVLMASSTLVQQRKRLSKGQQDQIALKLEEHSREFCQLLERISNL